MADSMEPLMDIGSTAASKVFDSKENLADLCAKARVQYAHKNFELAADFYSRATELQAELNGEMNLENAEILFLYGRSLFKLGQSKSSVLGEAPGKRKTKQKPEINEKVSPKKDTLNTEKDQVCNEIPPKISSEKENTCTVNSNLVASAREKLFQFTGDENFDDSDVEEAQSLEGEGERGYDDGSDDLAAAFEVLDLTRVLFEKKLKAFEDLNKEGEAAEKSSTAVHYRERLADTHDLLAEISLENERFPAAITDCKAALSYKKQLYSEEQSVIAEAHFKLSLALEFASITSTREDKNRTKDGTVEVDQILRDEAVMEMEAAIKSTSLKLKAKQLELSKLSSPHDVETTRSQVTEVKEMLLELQNRLKELKSPAIDIKSILYGPLVGERGILSGSAPDESPDRTTARIEVAMKTANDVTGLIRKKAKVTEVPVTNNLNEKRKAEKVEQNENKKAKVDKVLNDVTFHS